jgi:hypothetical protein
MNSVLTHRSFRNPSGLRWCALWLLIVSQAAALPRDRVCCVVFHLAEQSESESVPESNEEVVVGEIALLSARSGRSAIAADLAPRSNLPPTQQRVAAATRQFRYFSELNGRNGIGGPLRC